MSIVNNKKYLSILSDRFFSRYQHEEQPEFVEFVTQWFKYAEESYIDENGHTKFAFWKTLSNLENFIDVDTVPNELLRAFVEHYANNFNNVFEQIPFFVEWETTPEGEYRKVRDPYGNIVYKYNNIRMFLKTSRKFFSSKGSYYSYMYLFKLFGGSFEIHPMDRDIIRSSDKKIVLSAPNPETGRLAHLHGISPDPYKISEDTYRENTLGQMVPIRDWWYTFYAYCIKTNLKEDLYKPMVLELVHPAGMKCIWKEDSGINNNYGWGLSEWGEDWGDTSPQQLPLIKVSASSIQFNNTSPGQVSMFRQIEITNQGTQPLSITNIGINDTDMFKLHLTQANIYEPIGDVNPTSPAIIGFGETKAFQVQFTPLFIGSWDTLLNIASNSEEDDNINIPLSGYCV